MELLAAAEAALDAVAPEEAIAGAVVREGASQRIGADRVELQGEAREVARELVRAAAGAAPGETLVHAGESTGPSPARAGAGAPRSWLRPRAPGPLTPRRGE